MSLIGVVLAVMILGGMLASHYRVHRAGIERIQVEADAISGQPKNRE